VRADRASGDAWSSSGATAWPERLGTRASLRERARNPVRGSPAGRGQGCREASSPRCRSARLNLDPAKPAAAAARLPRRCGPRWPLAVCREVREAARSRPRPVLTPVMSRLLPSSQLRPRSSVEDLLAAAGPLWHPCGMEWQLVPSCVRGVSSRRECGCWRVRRGRGRSGRRRSGRCCGRRCGGAGVRR
jgi:hypothetical protein